MTTEELEAALNAAQQALRNAEQAQFEEIRAVNMKHAHALGEARRAVGEAERAIREAVSAAASHPWEGRRVYRSVPIYASQWSSKQVGTKKVFGVVEVARIGTVFPDNLKYSRPSIGRAFVRLLKKDGTPGLQIERDTSYGNLAGWQLDEENAVA